MIGKAVENSIVFITIVICSRLQSSNYKITIISAFPTPIEMEKIVFIISITNKYMTDITLWVFTSIQNRSPIIQIPFQSCNPLFISIKRIRLILKRRIIIEVIPKSIIHDSPTNITSIRIVIHFHRHPTMIHQCGHRFCFDISITTRIYILHIIPVIIGITKVSILRSILRM